MTEQGVTGAFDFETLRRAIQDRDAGTLAGLYATGAELRIVNRNSPPGSPSALRGKDAITDYFEDVCGRAMIHRIGREVVGEERVAFDEECEDPDGDGRILHQTNVEVWDE